MEIRFKDGKPLLVGGLVAGSQTCCCENPPPPNCYCPDFCSYFMSVVSPSDLAVKSPTNSCGGFDTTLPNTKLVDGWRFSDDLGEGYEIYEGPGRDNYSLAGATDVINRGFGADVRHQGHWRREYTRPNPFNPSQPFIEYIYARFSVFAYVSVACVFDEKSGADVGNPRIPTINVFLEIAFRETETSDEKGGRGLGRKFTTYYLAYNGYFPLPVDCIYNESRSCFRPPYWHPRDGFHHVRTPLDVVVQKDKVTIGDVEYPLTVVPVEPGQPGLSRAPLVDEVVDAFSATFRITSRPTCRTVPADCDVPIGEGNTRVFWGGETPEFVLGTPELMSVTDPVTNDLLYYEHLGGSGTIVYPYKFFFERTDNPNTQTLEQQYLDLYCESDNNVSPPVTAWYVVHQTIKYCAGPFTVDQWAGTIDTYAAPENCGNISAGDPVPIGEPTMERSIGYPQDSTGGCGATAPRIRFEIQAPCSV